MKKINKEKSQLTERVWLRISKKNKKNLEKSADQNQRTLGSEADVILTEYFTK